MVKLDNVLFYLIIIIMLKHFVLIFHFFSFSICAYEVRFEGKMPQEVLQQLEKASDLINLKNSPPATQQGLRHRADLDTDKFIKVLHSHAYYNAHIQFQFDFNRNDPLVTVSIDTGSVYPIANFSVVFCEENTFPKHLIDLQDLGITIGNPALPKTIYEAEDRLLDILALNGYPMAEIQEREVLADQTLNSAFIILHVNSGPAAYFGNITICGNKRVKQEVIKKKISWKNGSIYDPEAINFTQSALEASGLFSCISITPSEKLDECQSLPIQIEVVEAKHRSIGAGLTYNTQLGPGFTAEWEHRNIRGLGEKLTLEADVWQIAQNVRALYVQPDYLCPRQDLLWLLEYQHERTKGFTESSFSLSRSIEKQISLSTRISYGIMYKKLYDTRSAKNGKFDLLKLPMLIRWSNADSLLDPTTGHTVNFKLVPSFQIFNPQFAYCINTLSATSYYPLTEKYILAAKATFGSIWGSGRRNIPGSERFYEGSENAMRGYRYLTVSPLNDDNKPIGGRSMMLYTLELRARASECFGWVIFYDFGNVYKAILPNFKERILHSIGYGIRYHTPVGPLRLDIAFPLKVRRHLDRHFEFYLSIGQAF